MGLFCFLKIDMKFFGAAQDWIIKGLIFLLPLFFLPLTGEFYTFNKQVLLVILTLFGWLAWALGQTRGEFRLRVTPFDLPVLATALVFIASTVLVTPNKYDALLGITTWIVAGTLFYFLVVQYLRKDEKEGEKLASLFLLSTAISALVSLLTAAGVFGAIGKTVALPIWLTQPGFTVTGDLLSSITLYAVAAVLGFTRFVKAKRSGNVALSILLLGLVLAGLGASVYQALPGKPTSIALLPLNTGWDIALETFKRNILLGVGPGNFTEAFNRFRSVEFNTSSVWALRFTTSSNWYLHVWTVAGLLGIASFGWIALTIIRKLQNTELAPAHFALASCLVVFLFLPGNLLLVFTFYLLLALFAQEKGEDVSLQFAAREAGENRKTNLLPGFIALLALVLLLAVGYWGGRAYAAEMSFRNALNAAGRNDGKATYDAIVQAVRLNPRAVQYRSTAAQTNLAIANSLASKKDLTDQERQTVAQLVQQSIREAQAAVALHRTNSANWESLARLYQSLMSFAKDADQFTLSSYQQAIALDPVNPLTRISFGGVYYALKQYDNAIRAFELAVASKPDLANAHYNLAIALREKGETQRAYQEMQTTVALLKPGTQDYDKAKAELDELQKKAAAATATGSAAPKTGAGAQPPLEGPAPAPSPVIEPQLDLPDTAAPPATESAEPTPVPVR